MRLNLIRAVLLMMTLSGAAACAADLDCRNVRTGVEKLICTTPELRAMDEDLTALSHLIDATADAKHQSAARQHWRGQLNRCLGRVQCVRANYISRVSDLLGSSRLKLPEAAHADMGHATVRLRSGWVIDDRDGQAPSKACVQMRDYLNREAGSWWRQSDNLYFNYCAAGASNGPLFQLPPWETLDPQEHMTLLMALLRYRDEKQHLVRDSVLHDEEYYRKEASQFIAQGAC